MAHRTTRLTEEELLSRARGTFPPAHASELQPVIQRKIKDLRHYNVEAINRVLAICAWGRTGSLLLASYLDGHDNVVMLPTTRGQDIYPFFEHYPKLSVWNKLIAYPFFVNHDPFFQGDFAIDATNYYAAVKAIFEVYGNRPSEFLESRKTFFQFVHVAYSLALDRHPATPEPIMVHAQHAWDRMLAEQLVEDFPQARFIHAVRDPISNFDRWFDWTMVWHSAQFSQGLFQRFHFSSVPLFVVRSLLTSDGPHPGMESRTRAIRFEDLHCDTAKALDRVVNWLGLPFHSCLVESTFNGTPYVVERDGKVWSGQRPEQAQRCSKNISWVERTLIFALLYDNFASWHYPCPKIFSNAVVRGIICMLLLLLPMKIEVIAVRAVFKLYVMPSLRRGNVWLAMHRVARLVYYRLAIMSFLATECFRRLARKKIVLRPLYSYDDRI